MHFYRRQSVCQLMLFVLRGNMKLQGLGKYKNINSLVLNKINEYSNNPTDFLTLFHLMFSEEENTLAEYLDRYRIKEISYGTVKNNILIKANQFVKLFSSYPKNSLIGISMFNSVEWIETFWGILLAGFRPLLINIRLPLEIIEKTLKENEVVAVITDSLQFESCQTIIYSSINVSCDYIEEDFKCGSEIIFMSSGTQGKIKLCAYTSKQLYYQICDTYFIKQVR